jgi:hypothetical protein
MANDIATRKHWTEAQMWTSDSGETVSAGELIKRNDRYFRINRMPSLCCATFTVRDEQGIRWSRNA